MFAKLLGIKGTWSEVKGACRNTIGRDGNGIEPDDEWKRRLLFSEHSPIRKRLFTWKWFDLPYWVSTHFVRHKFGIEHFISTQRTDRTGEDRDNKPQGAFVMHEAEANAQALITISRKRLCCGASTETTQAWKEVKAIVGQEDAIVASMMVRECVYRNGLCPEVNTCGFNKTPAFQKELKEYLKGMENQVV